MHMGTWVPRVTTAWGPAAGCADLRARVPGVCGVGRRGGLFQKDRAQIVHSLQGQHGLPSVGGRGPCGAGLGSLEDVVLDAGWSRRGAGGRQRAEWLQRQASRDLCWFGVGRGRVSVQALTGHSELDIQKYRDTGPDMAPLPGAQKWSLEQGWCRGLL